MLRPGLSLEEIHFLSQLLRNTEDSESRHSAEVFAVGIWQILTLHVAEALREESYCPLEPSVSISPFLHNFTYF